MLATGSSSLPPASYQLLALPCGSESINVTSCPDVFLSEFAKLIDKVVFPEPPLVLSNAITDVVYTHN